MSEEDLAADAVWRIKLLHVELLSPHQPPTMWNTWYVVDRLIDARLTDAEIVLFYQEPGPFADAMTYWLTRPGHEGGQLLEFVASRRRAHRVEGEWAANASNLLGDSPGK